MQHTATHCNTATHWAVTQHLIHMCSGILSQHPNANIGIRMLSQNEMHRDATLTQCCLAVRCDHTPMHRDPHNIPTHDPHNIPIHDHMCCVKYDKTAPVTIGHSPMNQNLHNTPTHDPHNIKLCGYDDKNGYVSIRICKM